MKRLLILLLLSSFALGQLQFTQLEYVPSPSIPQGAQHVIAYRLQLIPVNVPTGNSEIWDSLTFINHGPVTANQLDFTIFEDSDQDGKLEASDSVTNYGMTRVYTHNRITLNFINAWVAANSTKNYFVVFDLAASANYGNSQVKLTIAQAISTGDNYDAGNGTYLTTNTIINSTNVTLTRNFHVSAIKAGFSKSPTTHQYQQDTETPIFYLNLKALIDTNLTPSFNFKFRSWSDSKLGVINIYEDVGNVGSFSKTVDQFIISRSFYAADERILTLPVQTNTYVNNTSSRNFVFTVEADDDLPLGTSMNIEIAELQAHRQQKSYTYTVYETLPSNDLKLAGLWATIDSQISTGNYIGGIELPIFALHTKSFFTPTTLNRLILHHDGDIILSNNATINYIAHVYVYADSNHDGVWNSGSDTRILTVNWGDYVFVSDNAIVVTLNQKINQYTNTTTSYFINYFLTRNIEENKGFEVRISDIVYTSWLDDRELSLADYILPATIVTFQASVFATLRIEGSVLTSNLAIPRGYKKHPLYYLETSYYGVSTYNDVIYFDHLVFSQTGSLSLNHLTLYLVRDEDMNGMLDASDPTVGSWLNVDYLSQTITVNTISEAFALNSENAYFVVTDIAPSADGGTDVLKLNLQNAIYTDKHHLHPQGGIISQNLRPTANYSVSGLRTYFAVTNSILVYPVAQTIQLITLDLRAIEEDAGSIEWQISLSHPGSTYLGTFNVIRVEPTGNQAYQEDTILTLNPSMTEVFTLRDSVAHIRQDLTKSYVIRYRPALSAPPGTTFNIAVTMATGNGQVSNYPMTIYETLPSLTVRIAGLVITHHSMILDSVFIGGMEIPIASLELRSYFMTTTVNELVITNDGTIIFSGTDQNRIQAIRIYKDSNLNDRWDDSDDSFLEFNPSHDAYTMISLNFNQLVTTYNLTSTDAQFIITFLLGPNVETDRMGKLDFTDTTYHDHLFNLDRSLKRVLETDQIYRFQTGEADLYIPSYDQKITTTTIEGQILTGVFHFTVQALNYVSEFSMQISHNLPVLTGDDFGVKRILILEDKNSDLVPSNGDMIHQVITTFNSQRMVTFTITNLWQPPHHQYDFLVLYDFGQNFPDTLFADQLQFSLSKTNATARVAALLPFPHRNGETWLTENKIAIELSYLYPNSLSALTSENMQLQFHVQNNFNASVSLLEFYPQFYRDTIQSQNVSYQFNLTTTTSFPVTLAPAEMITIAYIASLDQTFEPENIFIDGFLRYLKDGHTIELSRAQLTDWEALVSGNTSAGIAVPTESIIYLEYPNYIELLERETYGTWVRTPFRNGEIIENQDSLLIHFVRNGRELDLLNTRVMYNGTILTANGSPRVNFDLDAGYIKAGPFTDSMGTLILYPKDHAGHDYPPATISFYKNDHLFIENLLVYPSPLSQQDLAATPLKIGFLMSRPGKIKLYLNSSNGDIIWTNSHTYYDFGYKLIQFNGTMSDGTFLEKGLYVLKAILTDLGDQIRDRAKTKFVVY